MSTFLVDLLCIGAITHLTLGIARSLGWLNFSDSHLSLHEFTTLPIYLVYSVLSTKLNHSRTIGKMVFGIRVISFDEEELSWLAVLVRENVCRLILEFSLLMLGYLPAVLNQKKQHLGNFPISTSVVMINLVKALNQEVNS